MLLQTNQTLTKVFQNFLRSENIPPLLIEGVPGTGRSTHILSFIRELSCTEGYSPFSGSEAECDCLLCKKILGDKSVDVKVIEGGKLNMDQFKEVVGEFVGHNPVELSHLYLVFKELQLFSKDVLDTVLKILEEPSPQLRVFATTSNAELLPDPVVSRFFTIKHPVLTLEELKVILGQEKLKPYLSLVEDPPCTLNSVNRLILYKRFRYEEYFSRLFAHMSSFQEVESGVKYLLNGAKGDPFFRAEYVIEEFLDFYVERVRLYCRLNVDATPGLAMFEIGFNMLVGKFSGSLFKYISSNISYFYINLENQMYCFFASILILKKMVGF